MFRRSNNHGYQITRLHGVLWALEMGLSNIWCGAVCVATLGLFQPTVFTQITVARRQMLRWIRWAEDAKARAAAAQ